MPTEQVSSCNCTPVVGTRFGGRLPSIAIIEAIAAAEGVAPTELDPLYGTINTEAIDQLFADDDVSKLLQFSAGGWNVFVRGDGAIRICDSDCVTDPSPVFEKPISD